MPIDADQEACSFYIAEKRRAMLRERMKAGYLEMAELNRALAEEFGAHLDKDEDWSGDAWVWRKA